MGETYEKRESCWSPWRYLAEHHPDVHVYEAELPSNLMGCVDHFQHIIWLDKWLTAAEQRCTLAHEIGHLELDPVSGDMAVSASEDRVDAWASRLLIPMRPLLWAFRMTFDLDEMAEQLWVDRRMLRARLRCLTDDEQDRVMAAIREHSGVA